MTSSKIKHDLPRDDLSLPQLFSISYFKVNITKI